MYINYIDIYSVTLYICYNTVYIYLSVYDFIFIFQDRYPYIIQLPVIYLIIIIV